LIKVENLTKIYKQPIKESGIRGAIKHFYKPEYLIKKAVNNISFTINDGESVAYLGKNGAGKSTTIKMLTGIMQPSSGTILVDDKSPQKNRSEYLKNIGVVFGQRTQLWWDISIDESFKLLKEIYNIDDKTFKENIDNFSEILGLRDFIDLSARRISLGQRMRADIAASLLHNPKILYLDEPTIGLDIVAKEKIREFINFINKEQKTTILLTTHDIDDIQRICQRLILIDDGNVIYDGSLEAIVNKYAQTKTIYFRASGINLYNLKNLTEQNMTLDMIAENEFSFIYNKAVVSASEVISKVAGIVNVEDIRIEEPGFEYILKKIYEGELKLKVGDNK